MMHLQSSCRQVRPIWSGLEPGGRPSVLLHEKDMQCQGDAMLHLHAQGHEQARRL